LLVSLQHSTSNARFRQHDELRYSLRSAFKNTKSWKHSVWHIVTADVPDPDAFDDAQRLGLVPQWLDLETAWAGGKNGEPPVYLYHGSSLFRVPLLPPYSWSANQTASCFDSLVYLGIAQRLTKSINGGVMCFLRSIGEPLITGCAVCSLESSMAVESQLPHLDPEIVSENMCVPRQAEAI
jgi:hypothetical protein